MSRRESPQPAARCPRVSVNVMGSIPLAPAMGLTSISQITKSMLRAGQS